MTPRRIQTQTSPLLARGVGVLGIGVRAAIPVVPVDDAFRDVTRF